MRKILLVAGLVPALTACSLFATKRDAGFEQLDAPAAEATDEGRLSETLSAADEKWAGRQDRATLEAAIKLYEEALGYTNDGVKRREIMERIARGTYFLADGLTRNDPAKQKELYNLATTWGERCMAIDPQFKAKVDAGERTEEAVKVLGKEYAGCVYWAASGLGKWAKMEGFATQVSNKDRIKNFVEVVTEKDRNYFYGGPDRYWGAYYSIIPGFMGKDLTKSAEYFEASMKISPDYLGTKVLMADTLANQKDDRQLFETLLKAVIEADPAANAEIEPENRIEQEKARELLSRIDELYPQ